MVKLRGNTVAKEKFDVKENSGSILTLQSVLMEVCMGGKV